jgi:hypothetical protein
MGWSCHCGESHDDVVTQCWNCGTTAAGVLANASGRTIFGVATETRNAQSDTVGALALTDERTLASFGKGAITLTTHRVRLEHESFGRSVLNSMMLDQVSACAVAEISYPLLLVVAALLLVGSIAMSNGENNGWMVGLLGAVGFGVAYLLSRREVIVIGSPSAEIRLDMVGNSQGAAREFIEKLENAKDARYRMSARGGRSGAA